MYTDKLCGQTVRTLKWDSGCEDFVVRATASHSTASQEMCLETSMKTIPSAS